MKRRLVNRTSEIKLGRTRKPIPNTEQIKRSYIPKKLKENDNRSKGLDEVAIDDIILE